MKKQKTGVSAESVGSDLERAKERWAKEVFCSETKLGLSAWLIKNDLPKRRYRNNCARRSIKGWWKNLMCRLLVRRT